MTARTWAKDLPAALILRRSMCTQRNLLLALLTAALLQSFRAGERRLSTDNIPLRAVGAIGQGAGVGVGRQRADACARALAKGAGGGSRRACAGSTPSPASSLGAMRGLTTLACHPIQDGGHHLVADLAAIQVHTALP